MLNRIAPSILAADYANFETELKRIEQTEAEYIHIDIMDGQFVPNISFGTDVMANLRKHSKLVFDCHLMVVNPERYVTACAQAGADIMTIHIEATQHSHMVLGKIRAAGMKVGIAINPGTPVCLLEPLLHLVDQVLIMTVNPGFGGQAFLPECLEKITQISNLRKERELSFDIEVDGGIDAKTIQLTHEAGANVFVAGSYLFKQESLVQGVKKLKEVIND